ncbi:MAG TPA: patatin-like phospholipase family protein [Solirubrobacterales bacterium]|nr:patatin-like phospholipase family protein [Solirubrobacterales bacterium]
MPLDDRLDLYEVKTQFERFTEWLDLGAVVADLGFLRRARRTLLPLPLIDRPQPIDPSAHLPPPHPRPVAALQGKRIALIASGGGGAGVSLAGVRRAFEEAEVEPAEIVGCSGGAIWGAMWAAGMSSDEMTDFSLSWRPEDYLDIQWLHLPRFALSALRGFTGLAKGEAIERLFDSRLTGMPCGEMPIPITTIVYNMDLGRVEYFGSARTPEVSVGHLVRVAIALPLFIESVSVRGHLYVDGGIIENWPAQPAIEAGDDFDHVFGVNLMLPRGFEPRDISGWPGRTGGILEASRQLQQGYHLELARRARDELGEKLTLIEPIDDSEIRGVSFYDLFLDRSQWPRLIRQGYEEAKRALERFA